MWFIPDEFSKFLVVESQGPSMKEYLNRKVQVRLYNFPVSPMRSIKSNRIGIALWFG